jgi:hypothetical protein
MGRRRQEVGHDRNLSKDKHSMETRPVDQKDVHMEQKRLQGGSPLGGVQDLI